MQKPPPFVPSVHIPTQAEHDLNAEVRRIFINPEDELRIRQTCPLKELLDTIITTKDCYNLHLNICELTNEHRKYLLQVKALTDTLCIVYEFPLTLPDLGLLARMAIGDFAIYLMRMQQIEEGVVQ